MLAGKYGNYQTEWMVQLEKNIFLEKNISLENSSKLANQVCKYFLQMLVMQ